MFALIQWSVRADLMQARIIQPEVVCDLVFDHAADQPRDLIHGPATQLDGTLVDGDLVWQHESIVVGTFVLGDAVVEAEQTRWMRRARSAHRLLVWPVLDHDRDVVELLPEGVRKLIHGVSHQALEREAVHCDALYHQAADQKAPPTRPMRPVSPIAGPSVVGILGAMKLSEHPEYPRYLRARQTEANCRRALASWRSGDGAARDGPGSRLWTPEEGLTFVQSLSRLFTAYNRVLWEEFPYCRTCYGQCCVLDATRVTAFDCIALTLLGYSLPSLPERVGITPRECIYHAPGGCVWPADWRPVKCWLFYCALGDPTHSIVAELQQVLATYLPGALRRYEEASGERLTDRAGDPVELAESFDRALLAVSAEKFGLDLAVSDCNASGAGGGGRSRGRVTSRDVGAEVAAFVQTAAEQLSEPALASRLGVLADQLLSDLSLLEESAAAQPERADRLLGSLRRRYDRDPPDGMGEGEALWRRMRDCIAALEGG